MKILAKIFDKKLKKSFRKFSALFGDFRLNFFIDEIFLKKVKKSFRQFSAIFGDFRGFVKTHK